MGKWRYGVILDAGSSGTRVHVYRWLDAEQAKQSGTTTDDARRLPALETKKNWTKKVQPGLSSFGKTPEVVGSKHLADLVLHAETIIPESDIPSTPIFLLATAGMRLLPDAQRDAVVKSTCAYLQTHTGFSLPDCKLHIQVIPGEAEGLYGWIAANYLLGGFDRPLDRGHGTRKHDRVHGHDSDINGSRNTYGFLEMGGASAQIAFAPNSTEAAKHANDLKLLRLRTLDGRALEYRVFVTTWLGYGVHEARRRYIKALLKANPSKGDLPDPCVPRGLRITLSGNVVTGETDTTKSTEQNIIGKGSFSECMKKTFPLLDKDAPCEDEPCLVHGIHTPAIDFDVNHFVGTSEFWYSTHGVFEPQADGDKAYDFHTYQKKVDEFCNMDWKSIRKGIQRKKWGADVDEADVAEVCFKASWIINMLHDGIGVPRVGLEPMTDENGSNVNGTKELQKAKGSLDPFRAVDKIDDVEVSWTLGRMLLYASSQIPAADGAPGSAVGYGSNVPGRPIPADFQYGGVRVRSGDWHDTLFASSASSRRVPGFILFVLIWMLVMYLSCGRERRKSLHHRVMSMLGRGSTSRRRRGNYNILSPVRDVDDIDELEMGGLGELGKTGDEDSDSDSDAISISSPSRKRVGVFPSSFHDSAGAGTGSGPGVGSGSGSGSTSMGRTESRDRLTINSRSNVSGSRSRHGSPTRRGTPGLPGHKSSLD